MGYEEVLDMRYGEVLDVAMRREKKEGQWSCVPFKVIALMTQSLS